MFSKIEKFKATAWEKAGKYNAGHNRRVLLAVLIGIGAIALFFLKFIWTILAAILGETNHTSTTNPDNLNVARNEHLDTLGRKRGDPFYGEPMPDMMVWQGFEESKNN